MTVVRAVRRAFWRVARRAQVRALERDIERLSPRGPKDWYYAIDFGYGVEVRPELRGDDHAGDANWRFIATHLGDLGGKRILDVGCNAGLYALRMSEAGAREVVGLELDTRQAEFVRGVLRRRRRRAYNNVRFVAGDARTFDFASLGRFDLACAFCILYHLGDDADRVMSQLVAIADVLALQGNLPRVASEKYRDRAHQELAGVAGMSDIMRRHGIREVAVVAPQGHPKPLVIGRH